VQSHILNIGGDALRKTPRRKPQSRQIEFPPTKCTMVMPIPPKNGASLVKDGFYTKACFTMVTSFLVDDSNFKHVS
jgi:hypothetical protein